jgi:predicted RecA/RadA family phage recombinase
MKEELSMADYFINEGNKIGYLPTEFDTSGNLVEKTIKAGVDIVKGNVVELTDALVVAPTAAASANVLGVAMFDAKADEPVAVETEGVFKLKAGAAITAPVEVESGANGTVVPKGGTVTKVIGLALTDALSGGDVYVKFSI